MSGTITVVESETGSGKTEAALSRFVQLFEAGLVDGMYFALPTRTAATQLHERVRRAIQQAFRDPPPVVLAVPGYCRVDDVEGGQRRLAFFRSVVAGCRPASLPRLGSGEPETFSRWSRFGWHGFPRVRGDAPR